jgi:hypothetical protein
MYNAKIKEGKIGRNKRRKRKNEIEKEFNVLSFS